jgi:hypothetical protein
MYSNLQSQPRWIPAGRPIATALRIQDWLLNSGIQIRHGLQQGGICGWWNGNGEADFVYLEVTGYFLTFCRFLAQANPELGSEAISRANLALDWISRQLQRNHPPGSRQYLSEALMDWRAGTSFSFDLAMACRGIQAAADVLPGPGCQSALHRLFRILKDFCPGGSLQPCRRDASAAGGFFPERWSTRPGAYQMKAAAALLFPEPLLLPPEVRVSAEQMCLFWSCPGHPGFPGDLPHPDWYYIEGLVLYALSRSDPELWSRAADAYLRLMEHSSMQSYQLDSQEDRAAHRSDVIAQALRLGCIFRNHGFLNETGWRNRLCCLADRLFHMVGEDGAVRFAPAGSGHPVHWNSWCSMFACQAFWFYDLVVRGKEIPFSWEKWLI